MDEWMRIVPALKLPALLTYILNIYCIIHNAAISFHSSLRNFLFLQVVVAFITPPLHYRRATAPAVCLAACAIGTP